MKKMKVHCPKGNSPTCPSCGNWNAMLDYRGRIYDDGEVWIEMMRCRDCGFTVTAESVELTDEEVK